MNLRVLVAAMVATCLPVVAFGQPTTKPSPSTPVQVVNDATNPVPVTGSLQITNSSANPVSVTGTGSVSILGTPAFRNLDSEGRQPYVAVEVDHVNSSTGHCAAVGCDLYFPAVPSGKRLVIKHVAVRLVSSTKNMLAAELYVAPTIPPGQSIYAEVYLNAPFVIPANGGSLGKNWSIVSQEVFATVEAAQMPVISTTLDQAALGDFVTATITGYLVDTP